MLETYRAGFKEYVKSNILYHAKNISNSNLSNEEKAQYLKTLLFLRISFQENFDLIKNNDIDSLIALHSENMSGYNIKQNEELVKFKNNEEDYKRRLSDLNERLDIIASEKLTFKQEFWVIIFGFFQDQHFLVVSIKN